MRHVMLALLITGCGAMGQNQNLATSLEQSGYLADLSAEQATIVRAAIDKDGVVGALEHPKRTAYADAEALAEGGVETWLESEIGPLLAARGVAIPPIENRFLDDGSGYSILVGDREYWLWHETAESTRSWGTASVGAFSIVNDLLEAAGAEDRLHLIGGGNDGTAWLLTPAQVEIIRMHASRLRSEWPYIPVDDGTDWFGQPH